MYEYLQFEPRGLYHDAAKFIDLVEKEFEGEFDQELSRSMNLIAEDKYEASFRSMLITPLLLYKTRRFSIKLRLLFEPILRFPR